MAPQQRSDDHAHGVLVLGRSNVTTRYADDILKGFGVRDYLWDVSTEVQHQVGRSLSVTAGYYRNWSNHFSTTGLFDAGVTNNLLVEPADFSTYCITAPGDSRLPRGGVYQVCGLYDVAPAKCGQVNNLVSMAGPGRQPSTVFNGVDLLTRTRFAGGVQIQGGVSTGQSVTDSATPAPATCFVVDSPQTYQCHVSPTWASGTRLKFMVLYPLPWSFRASTIYQNLPGITRQATRSYSNAEIAPSLGRNLGSCGAAATCPPRSCRTRAVRRAASS